MTSPNISETAVEELQRCDDMANMVLEREWAEHAGKGPVSSRVEQAFTQLHNELAARPALTVWYGPMPESNGKSNFTAILMRKDGEFFEGITGGITIDRGEYPERVRYEADRMRYLIGELPDEPDITTYDTDLHSGYVSASMKMADELEVARHALKLIEEKVIEVQSMLDTDVAVRDHAIRAATWATTLLKQYQVQFGITDAGLQDYLAEHGETFKEPK